MQSPLEISIVLDTVLPTLNEQNDFYTNNNFRSGYYKLDSVRDYIDKLIIIYPNMINEITKFRP